MYSLCNGQTLLNLQHFKVGNQAFASYVDANIQLTHINNKYCTTPYWPV